MHACTNKCTGGINCFARGYIYMQCKAATNLVGAEQWTKSKNIPPLTRLLLMTPTFFRISSARVMKAFSTLMLALALVSKNLIPFSLEIYTEKGYKIYMEIWIRIMDLKLFKIDFWSEDVTKCEDIWPCLCGLTVNTQTQHGHALTMTNCCLSI